MKWVFFIAFPACILGLNLFLAWAVWRFFAPHKRAQFIGAGAVLGMLLIFALSFRLPRNGTGARYGESVSSSSRSVPMAGKVSRSPEFLNVTTPLMPK